MKLRTEKHLRLSVRSPNVQSVGEAITLYTLTAWTTLQELSITTRKTSHPLTSMRIVKNTCLPACSKNQWLTWTTAGTTWSPSARWLTTTSSPLSTPKVSNHNLKTNPAWNPQIPSNLTRSIGQNCTEVPDLTRTGTWSESKIWQKRRIMRPDRSALVNSNSVLDLLTIAIYHWQSSLRSFYSDLIDTMALPALQQRTAFIEERNIDYCTWKKWWNLKWACNTQQNTKVACCHGKKVLPRI